MSILEILLVGVGLSMDAFAVSLCKGLGMTGRINVRHLLVLGVFFGGFQALMPLLGFFLGDVLYIYIIRFGHWISFALLAFIGGKMLFDAIRERNEPISEKDKRIHIGEMFILAIATSIDAFAVGVSFSLSSVNIGIAVLIIGITTFVLSVLAALIGHFMGVKLRTPARLAGGAILVGIGIKILVEGLMTQI